MLLGVNSRLSAEVLNTMMIMGHGDVIAFVDANFPAQSVAQSTILGAAIDWAVDAEIALEAVLEHFPIDTFQPEIPPVQGMQVVGASDEMPEVVQAVAPLLSKFGQSVVPVERMEFYQRAKACFAVVQLAEHRPYGNFVLRKGVVGF